MILSIGFVSVGEKLCATLPRWDSKNAVCNLNRKGSLYYIQGLDNNVFYAMFLIAI